jgi:predicted peptidase
MRLQALLVVFMFLAQSFINSADCQPSLFSYEKYVNSSGDSLLYRKLSPDYDTMRKFPLVIFLHGAGERGNDNQAQLKWGVMNFATDQNMKLHPCFVIAPQCPVGMSWAGFSGKGGSPNKTMELLIALVQDLLKKLPVETNRVYITGLSMGGFGTFELLTRQPELFAAAVPVCGGGDISKANLIKHIPIWIFHGAEDPAVNPALSFTMVEALTKAGAHPGYTQYPEVGHFSWIAAYSDPLMMEWLFRQHK